MLPFESFSIGIFVNTARGGAGLMICVLRGPEGDRVIPAGMFENASAGLVFFTATEYILSRTIIQAGLCSHCCSLAYF